MKPTYFILLILSQVLFFLIIVLLTYLFAFSNSVFDGSKITPIGIFLEVFSLSLIGFCFILLVNRYFLSLFLTLSVYVFFIIINLEKINFFYSPLFPYELLYIEELILAWDVFKLYIPKIIALTLSMFFLIWIFLIKEKKNKLLLTFRFKFFIFVMLTFSILIYKKDDIKDLLLHKYQVKFNMVNMVNDGERFGLLFHFMKNIVFFVLNEKPKNYSLKTIDTIFQSVGNKNGEMKKIDDITLIIYMIESFVDPAITGIKTTIDPIPFFHELQNNFESGYVLSPVVGGRSANAEFELLTGFSFKFFNQESIPYNDIPNRKIPSLANELHNLGFYSSSLHVANLDFFNYKKMYLNQGFDNIETLWLQKNIEKDPADRYPSDSALVDKIIETSKLHDKSFIFAFPNSTHSPWNYSAYNNSNLDAIYSFDKFNIFDTKRKKNKLKIYLNALKTIDLTIEKLIGYFSTVKKKTVILILGDHQPAMNKYRMQYFYENYKHRYAFKDKSDLKKKFNSIMRNNLALKTDINNKVPYVIWTNFDSDFDENNYQEGMNSLILRLFNILKIKPNSFFYKFLKEYSTNNSYISLLKYTSDDKKDLSLEEIKWHNYFENLQYDYLFGNNYSDNSEHNNLKSQK